MDANLGWRRARQALPHAGSQIVHAMVIKGCGMHLKNSSQEGKDDSCLEEA